MSLADFQFRAATMADLDAVLELKNVQFRADYGDWSTSKAALLRSWQNPAIELERDSQIALTPTGQLVAYAFYQQKDHVTVYPEVYVLPAYRGQGLGGFLLQGLEARARSEAPTDAQVMLTARVSSLNLYAMRLHECVGYTVERSFSVMAIELQAPPAPPQISPELQIRPFVLGQDEHTAYLADEEAFRDDRDHTPRSFEAWQDRFSMRTGGFDASLCFLVWDGEEIAGLALNAYQGTKGWIEHVGVRRPWRRQGVGRALMLQSFAEFYRRGTHCVGLNVDAQSLTRANLLYERAGMRTIQQYHIYQKQL